MPAVENFGQSTKVGPRDVAFLDLCRSEKGGESPQKGGGPLAPRESSFFSPFRAPFPGEFVGFPQVRQKDVPADAVRRLD